MNNLVYFWAYSGWAYNCDSFLGFWGITEFIFEVSSGWAYDCDSFLIISTGWVYDYDSFLGCWVNNLVYL